MLCFRSVIMQSTVLRLSAYGSRPADTADYQYRVLQQIEGNQISLHFNFDRVVFFNQYKINAKESGEVTFRSRFRLEPSFLNQYIDKISVALTQAQKKVQVSSSTMTLLFPSTSETRHLRLSSWRHPTSRIFWDDVKNLLVGVYKAIVFTIGIRET